MATMTHKEVVQAESDYMTARTALVASEDIDMRHTEEMSYAEIDFVAAGCIDRPQHAPAGSFKAHECMGASQSVYRND